MHLKQSAPVLLILEKSFLLAEIAGKFLYNKADMFEGV